jgi:hypothetical protein
MAHDLVKYMRTFHHVELAIPTATKFFEQEGRGMCLRHRTLKKTHQIVQCYNLKLPTLIGSLKYLKYFCGKICGSRLTTMTYTTDKNYLSRSGPISLDQLGVYLVNSKIFLMENKLGVLRSI